MVARKKEPANKTRRRAIEKIVRKAKAKRAGGKSTVFDPKRRGRQHHANAGDVGDVGEAGDLGSNHVHHFGDHGPK